MSRVVYVSAPLGLKLGPPRPVICKTCHETTASCRCFDAWFSERLRIVEGSDSPVVNRG